MENNFWTDEKVADFFKEHLTRTYIKKTLVGSDLDFVKQFREGNTPKMEYEILSYQFVPLNDKLNPVIVLPGGKYWTTAITDVKSDFKINSVKRIEDGKVFTIGDKVSYGLASVNKPVEFVIDHFFVPHGPSKDILARSKNYDVVEFVGTIKKVTDDIKPPLGIMPEAIWKEKRIQEIDAAIKRYTESGKGVPINWIVENYMLKMEIENKKEDNQ